MMLAAPRMPPCRQMLMLLLLRVAARRHAAADADGRCCRASVTMARARYDAAHARLSCYDIVSADTAATF